MSHDEELRAIEREILIDPAALEPRRRHAQALLRSGDEEKALGALDLAWRLGAEDLWDDLRARLEARAIKVPRVELRYVPGGPFVMGSDDLDEDAKPAHLVHLAPFYVTKTTLTYGALDGWSENYPMRGTSEQAREWNRPRPFYMWRHQNALDGVAFLASTDPLGGKKGTWSIITEAQWERAFRVSHGRKDRVNLYGVVAEPDRVEWIRDEYSPEAYGSGPRRDPVVTNAGSGLWAVRAVPGLPPPLAAIYREAATENGQFVMPGTIFEKSAGHEAGFGVRAVFVPAP